MNSLTYIHDFEKVRVGKTSVLARIFFDYKARQTHCFWMSKKQWNKLCDCQHRADESRVRPVHIMAVFDNDRFVWAGLEYPDYSDREFLEKTFEAEWTDNFEVTETTETHVPEKLEPENKDADASLVRGSGESNK